MCIPHRLFFFFCWLARPLPVCPLDYLASGLVLRLLLRDPQIIVFSCINNHWEFSVSARGSFAPYYSGHLLKRPGPSSSLTERRQFRKTPSAPARRDNATRQSIAATPDLYPIFLAHEISQTSIDARGRASGRMPRPSSSQNRCPICMALRRPRSSTPPHTPISRRTWPAYTPNALLVIS